MSEATGYEEPLGIGSMVLACVAWQRGKDEIAQTRLEQALAAFDDFPPAKGIVLRVYGEYTLARQRYEAAKVHFQANLKISQVLENEAEIVTNQMGLAQVALAQGDDFVAYLTARLEYLAEHPALENTQHPFPVYLNVYHCLEEVGDSQASRPSDKLMPCCKNEPSNLQISPKKRLT